MSLELHVLAPTSLVESTRDAVNFERLWQRATFHDDRSTTSWRDVWFLPEDGGLVLKAQRVPEGRTPLQRLDRAFRLAREIEGLLAFARCGVPVPDVVAWGIERRRGLPVRTILLARRIEEAVDLAAFLRSEYDQAARRDALSSVGAAIRDLHGRGLFHRNLATRNVLVRRRNSSRAFEVWFVDCPRAMHRSRRWRHEALARIDRTFLARHLLRDETSPSDVEWLLRASGEKDPISGLAYSRRRRGRALSRANLWLWLGH